MKNCQLPINSPINFLLISSQDKRIVFNSFISISKLIAIIQMKMLKSLNVMNKRNHKTKWMLVWLWTEQHVMKMFTHSAYRATEFLHPWQLIKMDRIPEDTHRDITDAWLTDVSERRRKRNIIHFSVDNRKPTTVQHSILGINVFFYVSREVNVSMLNYRTIDGRILNCTFAYIVKCLDVEASIFGLHHHRFALQ